MSNLSGFVTADLCVLVQAELDAVYEGDTHHVRPDPGDVIADALADVRRLIRDERMGRAACNTMDSCTAEAIVLSRLADWMES